MQLTTEFPMKSKSINDGVERTFVLILDQGEEAFKSITDFAEREKITGASAQARMPESSPIRVGKIGNEPIRRTKDSRTPLLWRIRYDAAHFSFGWSRPWPFARNGIGGGTSGRCGALHVARLLVLPAGERLP
jgi:hypothetical protein